MQKIINAAKNNLPSRKKTTKPTKKNWYKTLVPSGTMVDKDGKEYYRPAICSAFDLSYVKFLIRNRDLKSKHIVEMAKAMNDTGYFLRLPIIFIYKGEAFVGDGQHLISAIKWLDGGRKAMETLFFLIEMDDIDEMMKIISILNSTSVRWNLNQFAKNYAIISDDYKKLLEYRTKFGYQYRVMQNIFMQETKGNTRVISEGRFKITAPMKIVNLKFQAINNLYIKTKIRQHNSCALGLLEFMNSVGVERYIKNEVKFLSKVRMKLITSDLDGKGFERGNDYVKFFNDCWKVK
jgi:hypothetical protein